MKLFYFHRILKTTEYVSIGPDASNSIDEQVFYDFLFANKSRLIDWNNIFLGSNNEKIGLTFDDGFYDFQEVALPLIEQFKVRVLVFVTTGFVSGSCRPYEYLVADLVSRLSQVNDGSDNLLSCKSEAEKEEVYQNIRVGLKRQPPKFREQKLQQICAKNDIHNDDLQSPSMLSWDDLKYVSKHPLVDIGAHTDNHPLLNKTSLKEAWREIKDSKAILENRLGKQIKYFAYPYGGYNLAVRSVVRGAGIKYAFTTYSNSSGNTALPRTDGVQWIKGNKS